MINLWIVKERLKTSAARHNGVKTILGAHLNFFFPLYKSISIRLWNFKYVGSKKKQDIMPKIDIIE